MGLALVNELIAFFHVHHNLVLLQGLGYLRLDFWDGLGGTALQVEWTSMDSHLRLFFLKGLFVLREQWDVFLLLSAQVNGFRPGSLK